MYCLLQNRLSVSVANIPNIGGIHSLEGIKKSSFLEWRDYWFCKVSVRSMRKLFCLSLSETLPDGVQDTICFESAGLQASLD